MPFAPRKNASTLLSRSERRHLFAASRLFQQYQQHNRRFSLDAVPQVRWHVDPGSGLRFLIVVTQANTGVAAYEEEHGWFGRCVFGEFLTLAEAEHYGLDLVVLVNRAAQDAVRRRLGFFGEIEDVGIVGHGSFL